MPIDYRDYPSNWKTEIRPRILRRAHNRCERCGVPNHAIGVRDPSDRSFVPVGGRKPGEYVGDLKVIRIVLTIAHLSHDVRDNSDENLMALCQQCHNRHDIPYRKANRAAREMHFPKTRTWVSPK